MATFVSPPNPKESKLVPLRRPPSLTLSSLIFLIVIQNFLNGGEGVSEFGWHILSCSRLAGGKGKSF